MLELARILAVVSCCQSSVVFDMGSQSLGGDVKFTAELQVCPLHSLCVEIQVDKVKDVAQSVGTELFDRSSKVLTVVL